jgi:palmitoyltransferase ZDHHC13/17
LNSSKLDDIINHNKNSEKKAREEEEAKILEKIEQKDYSQLNAVKATQYGVLERVRELHQKGELDLNKPDNENVYLLHWAAINNRIDIANYLLDNGVDVDPVGGELESTPMNWAARAGYVQMVVFLIKRGAKTDHFDIEGFSTIHLATMFAHSNVVAYLLVNGVDPDMPDKNGVTPLMYAAQRTHSRDPAQLLLTFNAHINAQDPKGNTPLHYCVAYNNKQVSQLLLERGGVSLDIKNLKGQTPREFALDRKKVWVAAMLESFEEKKTNHLPPILRTIAANKTIRMNASRLFPFLLLLYYGIIFQIDASWWYKLFMFGLSYPIAYAYKQLFFDNKINKYIAISVTLAVIFWCYFTWIFFIRPITFTPSIYNLVFFFIKIFSMYNFYKSWTTDPGRLSSNREQKNHTILQFVERNEFSIDNFCSACIIRKPIRSKHCPECKCCISKFDHHCPWVDNCIGDKNLKYFIGFLFWTSLSAIFLLNDAILLYKETCYQDDIIKYPHMTTLRGFMLFCSCKPWIAFFTIIAAFVLFWTGTLFICHIYQAIFQSLTTNERLNFRRYKHFFDKNDNFRNPFK